MGIMGAPRDELCSKKHLTNKAYRNFRVKFFKSKEQGYTGSAHGFLFLQMKP
jgi:hypothetical protein